MTIDTLKEHLKSGTANIIFTKLDGTERKMLCTKNFNLIPVDKYPKQKEFPSTVNEDIEKVFDLDINEWRSFRKDNLVSWNVV